jgi:hypothetical protein
MKYKVRRIINIDDYYNKKTGEGIPFLTYQSRNAGDNPAGTIRDATLEEIVNFMDRDAEDCNAHEFIGVHRLLAAALLKDFQPTTSSKETWKNNQVKYFMVKLAERGGLHSMNGLCGRKDSYRELGVGPAHRDWPGKF